MLQGNIGLIDVKLVTEPLRHLIPVKPEEPEPVIGPSEEESVAKEESSQSENTIETSDNPEAVAQASKAEASEADSEPPPEGDSGVEGRTDQLPSVPLDTDQLHTVSLDDPSPGDTTVPEPKPETEPAESTNLSSSSEDKGSELWIL